MPSMPDAIVLCGGAGLRLRSITPDGPKAMATIAGRPFLELLLKQLRRNGVERVILAVGYQRDVIRVTFGDAAFGLTIRYSEETSPLGTGGALRNAADLIQSDSVFIMNGDSYTDANLHTLEVDFVGAAADVAMIAVPPDGRDDCGLVSVGPDGNVVGFKEKQSVSDQKYVNAGIYMATRDILLEIEPARHISLEEDLLPGWLANGKLVRAFIYDGRCIDIGTPERYRSAQDILANVERESFASSSGSQST